MGGEPHDYDSAADDAAAGLRSLVHPLALFTSWGALAAIRENLPLFAVLSTVGAGSAFVCAGLWAGGPDWIKVGAWLFVFGACFAWYTGAMVLLEYSWGRIVLPFGVIPGLMKLPARANIPGARVSAPRGVRARSAGYATCTLSELRGAT